LSVTPITARRDWLPVGAIVAAGAVARLAAIRQPMRFDESISWAYYVGRSWKTIVTSYTYPNNHVFYSLLAKLTGSLFRYQPWALRIPAFVAGLAVIPLIWCLGRRLTDNRSALLASALVAGSVELTLYSTNARGYSLVTALFLAMLLVADDLISTATARGFALLALLGGLGLFTVPTMLYPLGVTGTWLLLSARRRPSGERGSFAVWTMGAMTGAVFLAALLYLPLILHSGLSALINNKFVSPSPWDRFTADVAPMVFDTFASWARPFPNLLAYALLLFAVLGVAKKREGNRASLALATAIWCITLLFATHRAPFVRVWLFLLPLFYLAAARGVWMLVDRVTTAEKKTGAWPAVALAALLMMLVVSTHVVERSEDTGTFPSADKVTALIAPQLRAEDRVLAPVPLNGPLLYYFTRSGLDSTSLTRTFDATKRIILVLDAPRGRDLPWAYGNGLIDSLRWTAPAKIGSFPDAEVWLAERR
jgi:hypothetical protein